MRGKLKLPEKVGFHDITLRDGEQQVVAEAKDVDVIMVLYAKITKRIIDSAKKLKGIVRYGIGVDNIDINE